MKLHAPYSPDLIMRLLLMPLRRTHSEAFCIINVDDAGRYLQFAGNGEALTIESAGRITYTPDQLDMLDEFNCVLDPESQNWACHYTARDRFSACQLDGFAQLLTALLVRLHGVRPGQPLVLELGVYLPEAGVP